MRRQRAHTLAAAICLLCFTVCFGQQEDAGTDETKPLGRMSTPWWAARHEAIVEQVRQHADSELLLIGDSITNNYDKSKLPDENFQPTWKEFYAPRKALNLGFSGDTTENVLWRLDHGEVDGLHPKAAVVLIGTNNTGVAQQSAEQTETGIITVVNDLRRRLPETRILLIGILPSDISPDKTAKDQEVNLHLLRRYGNGSQIVYVDLTPVFFRGGKLDTTLFYDPRLPKHAGALHPDTIGQRKMAEALEPTLRKLMKSDK